MVVSSKTAQANLILKFLLKINTELVNFSYVDYRKLFSITQVPTVKEVRSKKTGETLFVSVLKEKLNELSGELCRNIQGEVS